MEAGPVLLVDDDPVLLKLNALAVQGLGLEAAVAATADDAVVLAGRTPPALIISDVQMPGQGGFDLAVRLREAGLKTQPFLYFTGYDDLDILRGGLRSGGDDFLIKGAGVEHLKSRISFWMASGFSGLPQDLRRRALVQANRMKGDSTCGLHDMLIIRQDILDTVTSRITGELAEVPPGYGERLIERLFILARISKLVIDVSVHVGDYLRFPDYVTTLLRGLHRPWAKDVWPLLRCFDEWALDERFVLAGVETLKPFAAYDWFEDSMDVL